MLTSALLAALLSLQAVDLNTTCTALRRTGYREANPLVIPNCGGAIAETASVDVLGVWLIQRYQHSRVTRWVLYGTAVGIEAAVVRHNLHELHK